MGPLPEAVGLPVYDADPPSKEEETASSRPPGMEGTTAHVIEHQKSARRH